MFTNYYNISNNETNNINIHEDYDRPKKNLPKNQIFTIENFFPSDLCNELIQIINQYANNIEQWGENTNVNCKYIELSDIKNEQIKTHYDKIIFNYFDKFIKSLENDYNIECSGDSGYYLRKINGPTRIHKDGIYDSLIDDRYVPKRKIRNMSVIIALNDDYVGGQFYFPNQDFKIKLKKGQLIAFPPYWTHQHGVEELKNNTFRYTLNSWLFE